MDASFWFGRDHRPSKIFLTRNGQQPMETRVALVITQIWTFLFRYGPKRFYVPLPGDFIFILYLIFYTKYCGGKTP